tara:strand:+ start:286 stop:522 length:237 start_codon:yes stop_codon:yes gene_type:complete
MRAKQKVVFELKTSADEKIRAAVKFDPPLENRQEEWEKLPNERRVLMSIASAVAEYTGQALQNAELIDGNKNEEETTD